MDQSRQKKLFETMFNTIPDGVEITNTNREIQLANKAMEYTFGYRPDDYWVNLLQFSMPIRINITRPEQLFLELKLRNKVIGTLPIIRKITE